MCKRMPFPGENKEEIIARNKACQIHYDKSIADIVGPDGVDFLVRLLDKDPARRMGASQALEHPFLQ
jgi:serine/threonine protein kinase